VCILQGPVAVANVDGEGRACQGSLAISIKALIQRLLKCKYDGDKSAVPTIDYLAVQSRLSRNSPWRTRTEVGIWSHSKLDLNFLRPKAGFRLWLARSSTGFSPLFFSTVVQVTSYVEQCSTPHPRPRAGQKVVVQVCGITSLSSLFMELLDPTVNSTQLPRALSIVFIGNKTYWSDLFEERQGCRRSLSLQFRAALHKDSHPFTRFAPIHEIASGHNERIKQFTGSCGLATISSPQYLTFMRTCGSGCCYHSSWCGTVLRCAGNHEESFKVARNDNIQGAYGFCHRYLLEGNIYSFLATDQLKVLVKGRLCGLPAGWFARQSCLSLSATPWNG